MTPESTYGFALELVSEDQKQMLVQEPLSGLERIMGHFTFEACCRGIAHSGNTRMQVEPVFAQGSTPNLASAVRYILSDGEGQTLLACDYPLRAWVQQARYAGQQLVEKHVLQPGATYHYRIWAYLLADGRPEAAGEQLRPFSSSLRTVRAQAAPDSWEMSSAPGPSQEGELFDVFIESHVMEDILGEVSRAGEKEQGGFLVGRMHRDAGSGRPFCVVTAQTEARGAEATCTSIRFTDTSFTAARNFLGLRGRANEHLCGWIHSHAFCLACDKRGSCKASSIFFSAADEEVHALAFPQPGQIALVVGLNNNNGESAYHWKLYGWRNGLIVERQFQLVETHQHVNHADNHAQRKVYV